MCWLVLSTEILEVIHANARATWILIIVLGIFAFELRAVAQWPPLPMPPVYNFVRSWGVLQRLGEFDGYSSHLITGRRGRDLSG